MKTPSMLDKVVENRAAELSPSLLLVMTMADEMVQGNAAR